MGASLKTTLAGVAAILVALGTAIAQIASGGFDAVSWPVLASGILAGIGLLAAKDFNVSNAPTPSAAKTVPPRGVARLGLALVLLAATGCATAGAGFLGVSGTFGPIAVSADGRSTMTVRSSPVTGTPPACVKPIAVDFQAPSWGTSCAASIPVPPNAAGVCQ